MKIIIWLLVGSCLMFVYTAEQEYTTLKKHPDQTVDLGNGISYSISVRNTNWMIQTYVNIRTNLKPEVR
jgi:hypothetical protein